LRINTIYKFVNTEKPEEYIEIESFGDGVDPQDKAPGKAMTYSDKYALLKAYKIETGEDPDQTASQDLKPVKPKYTPCTMYTPCTTTMTLEDAKKRQTSKGKSYGVLSYDELTFIMNSEKATAESKIAAQLVRDELDMLPIEDTSDMPF
jgi:hypothetical protein